MDYLQSILLQGPVDNPGINQRALKELFVIVKERMEEWDYSILVSVLEIYNECVRDLLAVNHTERREVKQGLTGMYVPGLTQVQVSHLEEVNEVRGRCECARERGERREWVARRKGGTMKLCLVCIPNTSIYQVHSCAYSLCRCLFWAMRTGPLGPLK